MRYLGLDLGTKTLGLAISDKLGTIASPYKVLRHDNDYSSLINTLIEIITLEKVDGLVLGLPKNMNNSTGERALETLKFKEELAKKILIPIELVDERLSSVLAEKYLISDNMRREKRKKVIDSIAASIILDTFLEMKRNEEKLT